MAEDNTVPAEGQTEQPSSTDVKQTAPLPKNLEGKTAEEILKMYSEAERKIGEQSGEVREARETVARWQPIIDTIWENPEIFQSLETALQKKSNPSDNTPKETPVQATPDQSETRTATEGLIISKFEDRYGIDKMPDSERVELKQKIGQEIFDLTGQTISQLPLSKLETVLEKAFILANKDKIREAGKLEGIAESQGNYAGMIGAIPSSSGQTESITLSQKEREVAQKLGISAEKYLERKKQAQEYTR